MGHPPRIPVWLRWDQSVIYFVTICVADRKPVLANNEAFDAFMVAASKLRLWHILAAILMPDHLHVVVTPRENREAKLGNFSAALKRWMREELKLHGSGSPAASIGCCAPMNRCTTNGFTSRKSSACRTCGTVGRLAVSIRIQRRKRQAERLPYNFEVTMC